MQVDHHHLNFYSFKIAVHLQSLAFFATLIIMIIGTIINTSKFYTFEMLKRLKLLYLYEKLIDPFIPFVWGMISVPFGQIFVKLRKKEERVECVCDAEKEVHFAAAKVVFPDMRFAIH